MNHPVTTSGNRSYIKLGFKREINIARCMGDDIINDVFKAINDFEDHYHELTIKSWILHTYTVTEFDVFDKAHQYECIEGIWIDHEPKPVDPYASRWEHDVGD